jgi:DNA polymerase-1|tara:strand:- start:138 stop:1184 length:1047 start_codon:yes stop_codon:yes gene_type:complete
MNKKYADMLASLSNQELPKSANDRILIIDGLNTFIRSFVVVPTVNEHGTHVGGITGFLMSIGYAIRNIKPTRVIICFDGKGGSQRRRKIFPDYKATRRVKHRMTRINEFNSVDDERVAMAQQLQRLSQYLEQLPITVMSIENIEADDAMAYISQQVYPKSQCILMSTDKDFLQLVDDRVQVWSPTKKKFYGKETIKEEFSMESKNFLMYRVLTGDSSDNIPGIRGAGGKTLMKRLPLLFEDKKVKLENIFEYIKQKNDGTKLASDILNNRELLELNYKLMQLEDVDISGRSKESIYNICSDNIPKLVKPNFMKMLLEDSINMNIKNPELWLKDTFSSLNAFAIAGDNS